MTDDALVALARDIVRLLACLEDTATFPANSPERSRVVRTLAACECSLEDACTPDVILSLVERVQRAEKDSMRLQRSAWLNAKHDACPSFQRLGACATCEAQALQKYPEASA